MNDSKSSILVYPNPVIDVIRIDIDDVLFTETSVQVFDLSGSVVMQEKIINKNSCFYIHSLPHGVYIITIHYKGSVFAKRVVKNS